MQLVGTLPKVIAGSSGVIKSKRYPDKDIFWTHNDSRERIFAITGKGKLIREVAIPHATDVNWEEISLDERGRIVICDIGDNFRKRASFTLYRLPEPDALDPAGAVAEPQAFHFRYPKGQGPFDAEALVARAGQAWLFTKELDRTRGYRLPLPEDPPPAGSEPVEAELLGETKTMSTVTAASLTDDGRHLALISYLCVVVLDLPEPFEKMARTPEGFSAVFAQPRRVRLGWLGQTEGVCWDGNDLLLTSENGEDIHMAKEFGEVFRITGVLPPPAK
ncbi:MAG: hypothetical protein NTW87_22355 [Planctomycetota bacterium]|nr:hypothetical protein [Planctomycetota bacterium]